MQRNLPYRRIFSLLMKKVGKRKKEIKKRLERNGISINMIYKFILHFTPEESK